MIKSIELQNFQVHDQTRIDLHPGVNVITGQSDQGKSSIIRALNWLFFNKNYSFEEIRRRGTSPKDWTSVTVEIAGHTISRMRNRDVNKYVLDGVDLKAVGSNVPEEIGAVLRVSDVNIQSQLDSPYLLSCSPGEVAKEFNHLAGLQDIDHSLSSVKSQIGQTKNRLAGIVHQKSKVEEQLLPYKDLDKVESIINTIDSVSRDISGIDQKVESLLSQENQLSRCAVLISAYHNAEKDRGYLLEVKEWVQEMSWLSDRQKSLGTLESALDICSQRSSMLPLLHDLRSDVTEYQHRIESVTTLVRYQREMLSCQEGISLGRDSQDDKTIVERLRGDINTVEDLRIRQMNLDKAHREYLAVHTIIDHKIEEEAQLRENLSSLLKELGICPLCGSNL